MTTETKAAHTPGPWWHDGGRIFLGNGQGTWGRGHPALSFCIYDDCDNESRSNRQIDADARLIAAAPDLLDACKRIVDAWASTKGEVYAEDVEAARAAIAKAEGRE